MSSDTFVPERKTPGPHLTARSDPVAVHADQVDDGGIDLASMTHQNAYHLCTRFGIPCDARSNLPEGLCIATMSPCPYAPPGGSGKKYASDAAVNHVRGRDFERH